MIILLRCNDLNPDPRVEKYVKFYNDKNIKYTLIGWNRSGVKIEKENTIYFEEKAQYGARAKNILKKIRWNIFLINKLLKNRNEYDTIHACDFDTALPALFMKIFKKNVIFDVFDWIGNSNLSGIPVIDYVIKNLEKFTANKADYIIICEEGRRKQMNIKNENIFVLPNIPYIKKDIVDNVDYNRLNDGSVTISYVGVFDKSRNIEQLLRLASSNQNITLNIAGFGALQDIVQSYSKNNRNINYYGKVNYTKSLEIMKKSDIIAAMYCKDVHNHIYAAPNKYYEALMLSKPIITTKGTLIGNNVEKNELGFVIDEEYKDLENIFKDQELAEKIKRYSKNADLLWNKKFKNYVNEFMNNEYQNMILGKVNE